MSIRKEVDSELRAELQYLIEKCLPRVNYYAKLQGLHKRGDWEKYVSEDFLKQIENHDVPVANEVKNLFNFSATGATQNIIHVIQKIYKGRNVQPSGYFLYPETGFMTWHTNSDVPGIRLYITYTEGDNKSFFRYKDISTGEIITDYDDVGLTIREFNISQKPPYLWHCVGSMCDRYSFGFRVL